MEHELKPCPFCGGEKVSLAESDAHHYVGCDDKGCFAEGPLADTIELAIEKWNRRADA